MAQLKSLLHGEVNHTPLCRLLNQAHNKPNAAICLQLAAYARTKEDRDYFFRLAGLTPDKIGSSSCSQASPSLSARPPLTNNYVFVEIAGRCECETAPQPTSMSSVARQMV